MKRQRVALIILCSLIILSVPVHWLISDAPDFISMEKRNRAQWPGFSLESLLSGAWGSRADAWMTDNMPLREALVGVDSYMWYFTGRQAARDIFIDRRGHYVEAPFEYAEEELIKRLDAIAGFAQSIQTPGGRNEAADNTPGFNPDGASVVAHDGVLNGAPDGASAAGPPFVILIAPDAGSIAQLPRRLLNTYHDDEIAGAIATYTAGMRQAGIDAAFLDLRDAFSGSAEPLYYRTDHHWNGAGVYRAYTALGGLLAYAPLPESAFDIEIISGFYGSTYAKSGLWLTGPDTIELWTPPAPLRVTVEDAPDGPDVRETPFFPEYKTSWDMYSIFLGGIRGLTVIENLRSGGEDRTLFIIKDSFANSLIPLLAAHFKRIVSIDLRNYQGGVGELYREFCPNTNAASGGGDAGFLFVYSMNHIISDTDLLWLR